MHYPMDMDEWESVHESRPCTACNGDRSKCYGQCNGMASWRMQRRDPAEVKRIKAERERKREDEILAQADRIRAARGIA